MRKENREWQSEFNDILNDIKGNEIQEQKKQAIEDQKAQAKWERMKKELMKGKKITL